MTTFACRLDRSGEFRGARGVGLVVAAKARELGAARRKPGDRILRRRRLAVIDGLDAARLEPFAHEADTAAMQGLGPDRNKIGSRPGLRPLQEGVRPVAQRLERLGEAEGGKRALRGRKDLRRRRAGRNVGRGLDELGVGADAGDRRLDPCDVTPQRRRVLRDLALETAVREGRGQSALGLDLLESRPALVAERFGQRLKAAGPRSRIVDEAEVGFPQKDELAVAREPPRQGAGETNGERVRQHADAVRAAEARRKRGDRSAQHVQVRVAPGHHPPGALGLHGGRAGLEAAGLLDPRPEDAERPELGDLDEFLRVGGEPEGDHAAGFVGSDPSVAERAQEGDARREREGELLRRRPARRMHAARVGHEERTGETPGLQLERRIEAGFDVNRPISRKRTAGGGRERVEAERDGADRRLGADAADVVGESERLGGAARAEVELEAGPGVELHAVERCAQGRFVGSPEAEAVGAGRSGEDDLQAVGPV